MNCSHGVREDHIEGTLNGKTRWVCTNCNNKASWTVNHSSYGKMECFSCERAEVDWVACSDKCAKELARKFKSNLSSKLD